MVTLFLTHSLKSRSRRIGQLATRELTVYSNQLARYLQALGTNAPIRADIQREFSAVRAEQAARACVSANEPGRLPDDVTGVDVR
jgi:hypothetical protein